MNSKSKRSKLLSNITGIFKQAEISELSDGAATLAFYFVFALFPAILVLFSLVDVLPYFQGNQVQAKFWIEYIPKPVFESIHPFLLKTGAKKNGMLSMSFFVSLWIMANGICACFRQILKIERKVDDRSWFKIRLIALLGSLLFVFLITFPLVLLIFLNLIVNFFSIEIPSVFHELQKLYIFRYIIFSAFLFSWLSFIYYFGTNGRRFKEVLLGALLASIFFGFLTPLFEFYMRYFSNHNQIYGGLASAVALLLWLYTLGLIVNLGAKFNFLYFSDNNK